MTIEVWKSYPQHVEINGAIYKFEWEAPSAGSGYPKASMDKVSSEQEFALTGFALKRWEIERDKLEADPDVSIETRHQILAGYVKAWAKA